MANHILVWKHHIDVITDGTNWDALKKNENNCMFHYWKKNIKETTLL